MKHSNIKTLRTLCLIAISTLALSITSVLYFIEKQEFTTKIEKILKTATEHSLVDPFSEQSAHTIITSLYAKNRLLLIEYDTIKIPDDVDLDDAMKNWRFNWSGRKYDLEKVHKTFTEISKHSIKADIDMTSCIKDSLGDILKAYPKNKNIVFAIDAEPIKLGFIDRHTLTARYSFPIKYIRSQLYPYGIAIVSIYLILVFIVCRYFHRKICTEIEKDRQYEMIHYFCHDLKTPVNAIKKITNSIFDDSLSEEKRNRRIKRTINELEHIAEDVEKLSIHMMCSKGIYIQRQLINVEEVINNSIGFQTYGDKVINWQINIELDNPMFNLDAFHFSHILKNLISNALKYSKRQVTIDVSCFKLDNMLHIKISDTGLGISSKDLPHILEKGYRGENAISYYSGMGLGLAYVAKSVKAHDGDIKIESKIGEGSIFTIRLK